MCETLHEKCEIVRKREKNEVNRIYNEEGRIIVLHSDLTLNNWNPVNLSDDAANFTLDGNGYTILMSIPSSSNRQSAGLWGSALFLHKQFFLYFFCEKMLFSTENRNLRNKKLYL